MQHAYHSSAEFNDPVFEHLSSAEVKAMWQMLIIYAKDLHISCSHISADDSTGKCQWGAVYTFTTTGRKVHNIIFATFEFRERKIIKHTDKFDFWRWSKMALGTTGLLLGWSPLIINKVRTTARKRLVKFMNQSSTQV